MNDWRKLAKNWMVDEDVKRQEMSATENRLMKSELNVEMKKQKNTRIAITRKATDTLVRMKIGVRSTWHRGNCRRAQTYIRTSVALRPRQQRPLFRSRIEIHKADGTQDEIGPADGWTSTSGGGTREEQGRPNRWAHGSQSTGPWYNESVLHDWPRWRCVSARPKPRPQSSWAGQE